MELPIGFRHVRTCRREDAERAQGTNGRVGWTRHGFSDQSFRTFGKQHVKPNAQQHVAETTDSSVSELISCQYSSHRSAMTAHQPPSGPRSCPDSDSNARIMLMPHGGSCFHGSTFPS